ERMLKDRSTILAHGRAREAAEKMRGGEDIDKVAKGMKLEVSSPAQFGPADSVEGLGQAAYVKDAFTHGVGAVIGPIEVMGKDIVYQVAGRLPADMAAFAAEKENIRGTIRNQKANERLSLFMDSVTSKLTAEGKLKVNKE